MLRGNAGHDIFFADEDYKYFYKLVEEGVERYGHRVHAFCCMTNHVHIAIQVTHTSLSKIIQNLSFRYTRYINKKHKRIGHLFQGRYKAILVDGDSYLLELVRYIHLNPVRAKITKSANKYVWSSHRVYLGKSRLPWLTTDWVLERFSKRRNSAIRGYSAYIKEGIKEGYREEFHRGGSDGRILGEGRFTKNVLARIEENNTAPPSLNNIIKAVCKEYGIKPNDLKSRSRQRNLSEARGVVTLLATESKSSTISELARYFKRDISAISKLAGRIYDRKKNSQPFNKKINKINKSISQA